MREEGFKAVEQALRHSRLVYVYVWRCKVEGDEVSQGRKKVRLSGDCGVLCDATERVQTVTKGGLRLGLKGGKRARVLLKNDYENCPRCKVRWERYVLERKGQLVGKKSSWRECRSGRESGDSRPATRSMIQ